MARTVDPIRYEAKRQQILGAAYRCFARKGFSGTTTADLCRAAEVSAGNLFHYFPNKRAVFCAIFEDDGLTTDRQFDEAAASDDPWGGLLGHLKRTLADAADPDAGGFLLAVIGYAQQDPEFAALVERNDRVVLSGLEALLTQAAARGQTDGSVPPEVGARWLATIVDGIYLRASGELDMESTEQFRTLELLVSRFLGAEVQR